MSSINTPDQKATQCVAFSRNRHAVDKVPLSSLCDFVNGGTPSRGEASFYQGSIPWITSSDIQSPLVSQSRELITEAAIRNSATNLVPADTVLLVTRTSVGKVAITGVPLCFSQDVTALLPDQQRLLPAYLFWFLRGQSATLASHARGATIKGITREVVANLEIPLPNVEEQLRIAAILDQAEALRTQRRAALTELDTLTQALFLEMFGDPRKNTMGWPHRHLSALIRDGDNINYGIVQPGDDVPDGVRMLRAGDLSELSSQSFDPTTLKRCSSSLEKAYSRSRLQGDEILVSCVGTIGVVALVAPALRGYNIARAVARVALAPTFDRLFIAAQLRTEGIQAYFTSQVRVVAQPTLNIKQLAETQLIVPPLSLQQTFAQRLEAIEALKASHRAHLAELDSLFAALQQHAFSGQL
jgi:type I restriction enzyme, S subunit